MNTTAKRYIEADERTVEQLAKIFKCTNKMVYLALTYARDSDLARQIRYTAIWHFGATIMKHAPVCKTYFEKDADGSDICRQVFDNGAVLIVNRSNSVATLLDAYDNIVGNWEHISLTKLAEIHVYAEGLTAR